MMMYKISISSLIKIKKDRYEKRMMEVFIFYSFLLFWIFVAARGLSLAAVSRGYSLAAVHRCLIAAASPVADHRL